MPDPLSPPSAKRPWAALRQFVRLRSESAKVERCELCSAPLAAEHRHLLEPATHRLACACDACALLFDQPANGRYRRVPRSGRFLPDFALTDDQWDSLLVPISMVFFFHSTPAGKIVALYPSPAGPMESLLTLEAWQDLAQANPLLRTMQPDVEALLVNRLGAGRGFQTSEYYLAPMDACYKLVGLVRAHWRGFSGGDEVWRQIGTFFTQLKLDSSVVHAGRPRASAAASLVEKLANAVLYEGYILYPYRASAVKNQQRFNFGGLYPPAYCESQAGADACRMQIEILLTGQQATLEVRVRFLQLISQDVERAVGPESPATSVPVFENVPSVEVGGQVFYTWQEAVEREVTVPVGRVCDLAGPGLNRSFSFGANGNVESLRNGAGELLARVTRRQREVMGNVEVTAQEIASPTGGEKLFRVRIAIENRTPLPTTAAIPVGVASSPPSRDEALPHTMASTHAILGARGGEFVSLIEPPDNLRDEAAACRNVGLWPVLVGADGQRDTMLASPIILYDYPQIAPESPGDLCDGLEIDEILSLRILLLTDDEKREMRGVDARARAILERTERLPQEQLMKMHGVVRGVRPNGEASV